jgi:hypothetical protein
MYNFIVKKLDEIANKVEEEGLFKEAIQIDKVSNSIEKIASLELYLKELVRYMTLKKRDTEDIHKRLLYGIKLWPFSRGTDVNKALSNIWKRVLIKLGKTPEGIKRIIKSFSLNKDELERIIMPVEELAGLCDMNVLEFLEYIEDNNKEEDNKK